MPRTVSGHHRAEQECLWWSPGNAMCVEPQTLTQAQSWERGLPQDRGKGSSSSPTGIWERMWLPAAQDPWEMTFLGLASLCRDPFPTSVRESWLGQVSQRPTGNSSPERDQEWGRGAEGIWKSALWQARSQVFTHPHLQIKFLFCCYKKYRRLCKEHLNEVIKITSWLRDRCTRNG